jgi:hypothetical protein
MAEGQIKITITGNVGEKDIGSAGAGESAMPQTQTPAAKPDAAQNTAFFILAQQVSSQIQKIAIRGINNVGNLTGDYVLQSRVNTAMSAVSFFGGLAVAAKLGPVGLSLWAISTAVDEGLKQYEFALNQEKARVQRQYINAKNGEALRDNSRGGF